MKNLAFIVELCIMAVGIAGVLVPSSLVWIAQHFYTAGAFYLAGIAAVLAGLTAIEHARAIIDWWLQLGSGAVRLTGIALLAFGGCVVYACAFARRSA